MSPQQWDKAKIIRVIRKLRREKQPLNSWHMQRFHQAFYRAAYKRFGNWPKAIAAAGLNYEKVKAKRKCTKWSKEVICDTIKQLREAGEKINSNQIQWHHQDLYAAACKYFGSWKKATKAAGFDYHSVRATRAFRHWSREAVVRAIRSRKRRRLSLNSIVMEKEDRGLYLAAKRYFGKRGWSKALRKAGIDPKSIDPRIIWTKKKVVREIKQLVRAKVPIYGFYLSRNGYSKLYSGGQKAFGSWKKAVEAAGFDYDSVRMAKKDYWDETRILVELRRLERSGIRLSSKAIQHQRGDLFGAALMYFGSWGGAVEAAGFDYRIHCKTWSYKTWLRRLSNEQLQTIERQAKVFAKKERLK